ncbi:MAG: HDOD domain-containing protein [Desulfobacterales bacterium]|nr:HDOD domain-containing protein [Desulfobacterales bacterium]
MTAIHELLKAIDNLKPMPAIMNQIMTVMENPRSSMQEIAEVIQLDPIITATILKICNSAYFGLPRQIESLNDAITYLGMEQIIDIVIIKSGTQSFAGKQVGYGLYEGELWKHAVLSAMTAKDIADKLGIKQKHVIFTTALLKDIGKIILDRFVRDSFDRINMMVKDKGMSFREAEKAVLGIDHAEAGAILAKKWNFSQKMIEIIKNHHFNEKSSQYDEENSIIYIADNVCMMMGVGIGADGLAYRFHEEVLNRLGITDKGLQEIISRFSENMQKVEKMLNAMENL